jgi:hypothetical protein
MSNDADHASSLSPRELDEILSGAWETAARLNPMCLTKLDPDRAFQHLRGVINDCLAKGMTRNEVSAFLVQELLGSLPAQTASLGSASRGHQDGQVSS